MKTHPGPDEMAMADESVDGRVLFGDDSELRTQVLDVYLPHCRYLKTAALRAPAAPGDPAALTVTGEFEIGDSCYIKDTGHFNAVEFNICYNQLAYYLIAKAVKERLLQVLGDWDLDEFWRGQLPNLLIADFRSTFKREIRHKRFSGSITITSVRKLEKNDRRGPIVVLYTACQFWDETVGSCRGEVKIAITDPVAR
jgi:hypothetical protein